MNTICIGGMHMRIELCEKGIGMITSFLPLMRNWKEINIKKIPKKYHKQKAYIDFWIFLVYNAIMISQVIVKVQRHAAVSIISRSKMR